MATKLPTKVSYVRIMNGGGLMSFLRAAKSPYLFIEVDSRRYRLRSDGIGFDLRSFGDPEEMHDVFVPGFCGLTNEEDAGEDCEFVSVFAPRLDSSVKDEAKLLQAHRLKYPHGNRLSQHQWNMVRELNKREADQVLFDVVDAEGVRMSQVSVGDSLFVAMRIRGLVASRPWPLGTVTQIHLPRG